MARFVEIQGQITGVPGVYQDGISLAGYAPGGLLESGIVALVGECAGSIPPKDPTNFRTPKRLKELLGSGPLYDAARFAFEPSREDPSLVRGASRVVGVRVNPATQGTLPLKNGSSANLVTLKTRAYGSQAAGISVQVDAGTRGAFSKKLTIHQSGKTSEIGDNLGFLPAAILRYKGNGSAAEMSVTSTGMTTSLTGESDGSADLAILWANYPTLDVLAAYVNAQAGYEMVVFDKRPASFLCQTLDYVTGADIKTKTATISLASATASTFTGTYTGLANGDIVFVGSEYLYVSNAGSSTVLRGYGDSTAATHSSASAVSFTAMISTNQAIIDFCNKQSSRLTAERASGGNTGQPAALTTTFLTGASEGTTTDQDWQDALDALRPHKVNFVVVLSESAAIHAKLQSHLAYCWGLGGVEAQGGVGVPANETLDALRGRCKAINDANILVCFQEILAANDAGTPTWYPPYQKAVMMAGIQAGSEIGTPLTHKALKILGLRQNSGIDLLDQATDFVEIGLTWSRFDGSQYRVVRGLTSYTNGDESYLISPSVRNALAWTVYKVRTRVKERHFGKKGLTGIALSIKSTAIATLEECKSADESIVDGAEFVNGTRQRIPAYKDVLVEAAGNVYRLSYRCTPVDGVEFVPVNTAVALFQDAA